MAVTEVSNISAISGRVKRVERMVERRWAVLVEGGIGQLEAAPPCDGVDWGAPTRRLVGGTGEVGPPPPFEDSGTSPVGNGGGKWGGLVVGTGVWLGSVVAGGLDPSLTVGARFGVVAAVRVGEGVS